MSLSEKASAQADRFLSKAISLQAALLQIRADMFCICEAGSDGIRSLARSFAFGLEGA